MSGIRGRMGTRWTAVITLVVAAGLVAGGVALAKPPGDTPGGQANAATYFARVGDDGTQAVLVASRGVTSVSLAGTTDYPEYLVTFANPVATCGWTVSLNPSYGGPPQGFGPALVGLTWDNTVDPFWDQTPDPNVLRVKLLYSDGVSQYRMGDPESPPEVNVLDTFTVVANC